MAKSIKDIQARLAELGFDPGPVDGISGKRTKAAIRAAQRWHGLKADGIVGPITAAALWPAQRPESGVTLADTEVKQIFPRQKDVPKFYGKMGANLVLVPLPYRMRIAWDLRKTVKAFSAHKKCAPAMQSAFEEIAVTYSAKEITDLGLDLFGGCIANPPRKMRGGSAWSMHSWGIAIDFDPARNGLHSNRNTARLAKPDAVPFWQIWEKRGFVSLGRARNFDWMHIQAARL